MKRSMFSNPERRIERQREAQERNAERAKRTPQQQLAVLESRGVTTGREVTRLQHQVLKSIAKLKLDDK